MENNVCNKEKRQTKFRRQELKSSRSKSQAGHHLREGTTYRTGCFLEKEVDDDQIPPPEREPPLEKPDLTEDVDIVVFDLETTGTGN